MAADHGSQIVQSQKFLKRIHGLDVDHGQLAVHVVVVLSRLLPQVVEDSHVALDIGAVRILARIRQDHGGVSGPCCDGIAVLVGVNGEIAPARRSHDHHLAQAIGSQIRAVILGHEDLAGMNPLLFRKFLAEKVSSNPAKLRRRVRVARHDLVRLNRELERNGVFLHVGPDLTRFGNMARGFLELEGLVGHFLLAVRERRKTKPNCQ